LKSHFLDEPLEVVVKLATNIYDEIQDQNTIDEFFKYKSHVFLTTLDLLSAQKLMDNLNNYRAFKRQERIELIGLLKRQIDNMYADEKIKEEKLEEYTQSLVKALKRTSLIK
jgi:sulfatase maturation enzyme AslB (radical SAM superfamily)